MDDKQFQTLLAEMRGIHTTLAAMGRAMKSEAPNYQRPLSAYRIFDWASIGAVVLDSDAVGPSRVEYLGHHFTRRNGAGKFGEAIWFSRPQGKNEDGSNKYARLITFKDYSEAEELDGRIEMDEPKSQPASVAATPGGRSTQPISRINRPAAPVTPTAPPAPPTPPAASDPIPQKDWELDAMTSTDPLIFDTAVVHVITWFKDATQVATARESMFGQWVTAHAPAYLAGLKTYAKKRDELQANGQPVSTAHKQAKVDAGNHYRRELQAAGMVQV